MKRYQIVELTNESNHAGTKATLDISLIAERLGFKKLDLRMRTSEDGYIAKIERQMGYLVDWSGCYSKINKNSVVLLQHPFHYPQLIRNKCLCDLKKKKNVKFISVIHDVEKLRGFRYNEYYKKEFQVMLDIADVMIVHNDVMKKFFIEYGVPEEKLVVLNIFDYLQSDTESDKKIFFEKSITIAGNLDTEKCKYLVQLEKLKDLNINLYGPNYNPKMKNIENIHYQGSLPVNEIPKYLDRGFGLVWDGNSINGCCGQAGEYLRYNNPHKLSLYLSSGIPVIIWKKAAEAEFVRNNNLGILVDKLDELENILGQLDKEKYEEMCNSVKKIAERLKKGYYGEHALLKALERL